MQHNNDDKDEENEFEDAMARQCEADNYEQNLDYLNHCGNYHNDGQGNADTIDKPFLVTKTVSRRGRSRGAAAPFGVFDSRGGRTGTAIRSKSANSADNVTSSSNSSGWPKSGRGSRGGPGAYNKNKKLKPNENLAKPTQSQSPTCLHSDSSENSPIRKTTNRIKKKEIVISDDDLV